MRSNNPDKKTGGDNRQLRFVSPSRKPSATAHNSFCFRSSYLPFKYKIRSGSTSSTNGGYLNQVKIIIPHPLYNQTSKDNDIAVIQIIGLFNIGSPGVGSINVTVIEPPIALPAKLAGWGASSVCTQK